MADFAIIGPFRVMKGGHSTDSSSECRGAFSKAFETVMGTKDSVAEKVDPVPKS
jgi:hypothetical protein